ncbi:hypothetical protein MMC31_006366 [Peltigera leucophlebia]|nr:hypothetical protein [Peltigera leucophlebia]
MLIGRYPSSPVEEQPPTNRSKIAKIMRNGQPKLNTLWLGVITGGSLDTSGVSPVLVTSPSNLTPPFGLTYRNHLAITFGVEIEILVRPRLVREDIAQEFARRGWNNEQSLSSKERRANIMLLRQILASKLSDAGIPAHTEKQSYQKWTVDCDASIVEPVEADGSRPFNQQIGLEIISSIQTSLNEGVTAIQNVWGVLTAILQVKEHQSCSTHIHIGFSEGWSLKDLKRRAKGWFWVERGIEAAMPEHRRNCVWAVPNHLCRSNNENTTMGEVYAQAIETSTFASVFSFVDEVRSAEELIVRAAPERYLSWNLQSLKTYGTMEFRRPPQSLTAEDTVHWVEMAVGIVNWALAANFEDEKALKPPPSLTSI